MGVRSKTARKIIQRVKSADIKNKIPKSIDGYH